MIRRLFTLLAVSLIVPAMAGLHAAESIKTLNFGIISTESSAGLKTSFGPFLEDMEDALDIEVRPFFAPDYAGVIEAMRFKKVHVAWFGNKSAMEAVDRAGAEIFVQTVDVTGEPGYWSLLITHKDSPLNSLEDLLNSPNQYTFGNGDPNSTSGFLVPSYYVFALNNITPQGHFTRVRNANHETNALTVANKLVDVATNNTESISRLKLNHPDKHANIKIIWQSPLIPSDPIVYHSELPDEVKMRIKAFFLSYGRLGPKAERERQVLAKVSSGWAPFRDSSNDQLLPIRQLELFKDRTKIENDSRISAADKQEKLRAIDAQLDDLKRAMARIAQR